jgi:hypothetical protein
LIPITEIPGFIHEFASQGRLPFNQAQRSHLEQYLTGLIAGENHTVSAINELFPGHCHQSVKNHFMTEAPWDDSALEAVRTETIREALLQKRVKSGALIFDDSLLHKTGKKIPFTGLHYDHCSKSFIFGQQLVTSHFACKHFHVPLDYEIYQRAENVSEEEFQTKLTLLQSLFYKAKKRDLPFTIALMDSWFLCKDTVDFLEENDHFPYVAAAKSSLTMHTKTVPMSLADYAASLPPEAFQHVTFETAQGHTRTFLYFTKCVKLVSLGKVRLVITYDGQREKCEPKFMVTNQLAWEVRRILWEYSRRWFIERFYQEAKQHLGLEACELRTPLGIHRHFKLVFLADTLLQLHAMEAPLSRWFKSHVRSISEKCLMVKTQIVKSFIVWSLKQARQHCEVDAILEQAFAPASQLRFTFAD